MRRYNLGGKKLQLDIIPIDLTTLFATRDISDFQFMFASKITPTKICLLYFYNILIIYTYLNITNCT